MLRTMIPDTVLNIQIVITNFQEIQECIHLFHKLGVLILRMRAGAKHSPHLKQIKGLGHLDTWTWLGTWTHGHLESWTFGNLQTWKLCHLDTWTFGHLDIGHLDNTRGHCENTRKPTDRTLRDTSEGRHQESPGMIFNTMRRHETLFQKVSFLQILKIFTKSSRIFTICGLIQNLGWT